MDSSFDPPRNRFYTSTYDNNLEAQHIELKRFASAISQNYNVANHHIESKVLETIIEKIEITQQ